MRLTYSILNVIGFISSGGLINCLEKKVGIKRKEKGKTVLVPRPLGSGRVWVRKTTRYLVVNITKHYVKIYVIVNPKNAFS